MNEERKEFERAYEERFNWYILKVINKTYKNYLKSQKQQRLDPYGQFIGGLCDNDVIGDEDVLYEEEIMPKRLEDIMCDLRMHKAIKPLTFNEKVVVFLFFILEKSTEEIAKIMGYKDRSSINRVCNKAIKKIKDNYYEMEGEIDD